MKLTLRQAALLVLLHAATLTAQAQTNGNVGIGTSTPNASAVLDLSATNKGLLIPRLDSAQRVGIAQPATGLLVFQTSPRPGFYYYSGAGWRYLPDQTRAGDNLGSHAATRALNLGANALVGRGDSLLAGTVGVGVRADGGLNLGQNTAGNNVFLGYQAGANNTTGRLNQFSGLQSGYSNTTGNDNQFSGYQSGYSNTTGNRNQFSGYQNGYLNTTGGANQFNGWRSGFHNTTGNQNQFNGYESGHMNTTGSYNQFIGFQSGYGNSTGSYNWAFGYQAGPSSDNLTKAGAIGFRAKVSQSNSLVLGGTGTDAVRVGIGTTAPTQPLEVVGQVFSSSGGFRFPDNTVQTTASGKYVQSFTVSGPGYATITHNLNSTDVLISVVNTSTGNVLPHTSSPTGLTELKILDANTIRIGINLPGNTYRVVVLR